MSETAKKLYDEALKLDDEERSVLALRLLDSVGEAPEVIEKAWGENTIIQTGLTKLLGSMKDEGLDYETDV